MEIKYFMSKRLRRLFYLLLAFLTIWTANAQNSWLKLTDYPGGRHQLAFGLSINNRIFAGFGADSLTAHSFKDFWEYLPASNTWVQRSSLNGSTRAGIAGFSIGDKGYILTGYYTSSPYYLNDVWEYDAILDQWRRLKNFPGVSRFLAVGFSIGNKGFFGTGSDSNTKGLKDFWEYDATNDSWLQRADVPGSIRSGAIGFSIGNKGYIGSGSDSLYYNDFWEYDTLLNSWSKKADIPAPPRWGAVGFSIGNKAYFGCGTGNHTFYNDFWEYDQIKNNWTQLNDMPSEIIRQFGFSANGKGYIGTGYSYSDHRFSSEVYSFSPLASGISKLENKMDFIIYPVPNRGKFSVESSFSINKIEIIDVYGNWMNSQKFKDNISNVDLDLDLSPGVYLIRVENGIKTCIKKFIVE